jgi:magnesium chelatase family protein
MDFHGGIMVSTSHIYLRKPILVAKLLKSPARRCIGLHACPCGYYGDPLKPCTCSSSTVTRYQKRISGPLLDRIDIHVEVPRVDYDKLSDDRFGEPSSSVQERVESAREFQRQRFHQAENPQGAQNPQLISCNADMHPAEVRKYCQLDTTSQSLMRSAMSQMQLSARAYHRVLKLSRTIADLAGESEIASQHLAEALQYRPKLTQF